MLAALPWVLGDLLPLPQGRYRSWAPSTSPSQAWTLGRQRHQPRVRVLRGQAPGPHPGLHCPAQHLHPGPCGLGAGEPSILDKRLTGPSHLPGKTTGSTEGGWGCPSVDMERAGPSWAGGGGGSMTSVPQKHGCLCWAGPCSLPLPWGSIEGCHRQTGL